MKLPVRAGHAAYLPRGRDQDASRSNDDRRPEQQGEMTEEPSDEALMVEVSARQQHAFRILMQRHMPRALRVAQRIVRDPAEADDIGQEALLRVWSHAASFDPKVAKFTTWFYRIVLNLTFDRTRRRSFHPLDEAGEVPDTAPHAAESMIAAEEHRMLQRAMANLSDRQRGAIALFYVEGLSGQEAAEAMNLSAKAFESLLGRARAALRESVQKIQDTGSFA
ncbi:RNA polymerase sigma factor [Bradyrhizobium sp. MOS003]|uniref:RNA polymerase sigma factor n=1 Tax=Bradyrhizobium sp. MOS003 TaxID=2133946 RepID=UPI001FE03669|nr:RNA polymerase sigma factor [Bradyrhizobium sp. MOS003]